MKIEISDQEKSKAIFKLVSGLDFDNVKSKVEEFNPFNILAVNDFEIRHSNVLAWLLTSNAHHALGDLFFKKILFSLPETEINPCSICETKDKYCEDTLFEFNFVSVIEADYSDLEIKREWRNIDILAVSRRNKLVVVIENKFSSTESEKQLKKYKDIIFKEFKNYQKIFIFLTLDKSEPEGCQLFLPLSYQKLYEIIKSIVELKKEYINSNVYTFISRIHFGTLEDLIKKVSTSPDIVEYYKKFEEDIIKMFSGSIESQATLGQSSMVYRYLYKDSLGQIKRRNVFEFLFQATSVVFVLYKPAFVVISKKDLYDKIPNLIEKNDKIDCDASYIRIRKISTVDNFEEIKNLLIYTQQYIKEKCKIEVTFD